MEEPRTEYGGNYPSIHFQVFHVIAPVEEDPVSGIWAGLFLYSVSNELYLALPVHLLHSERVGLIVPEVSVANLSSENFSGNRAFNQSFTCGHWAWYFIYLIVKIKALVFS